MSEKTNPRHIKNDTKFLLVQNSWGRAPPRPASGAALPWALEPTRTRLRPRTRARAWAASRAGGGSRGRASSTGADEGGPRGTSRPGAGTLSGSTRRPRGVRCSRAPSAGGRAASSVTTPRGSTSTRRRCGTTRCSGSHSRVRRLRAPPPRPLAAPPRPGRERCGSGGARGGSGPALWRRCGQGPGGGGGCAGSLGRGLGRVLGMGALWRSRVGRHGVGVGAGPCRVGEGVCGGSGRGGVGEVWDREG